MIVVTTPTGQIGSQLVKDLLAANQAVRVIVRDPARLPAGVREKVEVVPGSHGDAAVVSQAFQGADAVFWVPPPAPQAASVEAAYLDFSRAACDAFRGGAGQLSTWWAFQALAAASHKRNMPAKSRRLLPWTT